MERRLAAIMAADVVDYTRLMAEDQQRTLEVLRQLRSELLEPAVTRSRGQVIKRLGDGWIVEFSSISDAVACAIEVQETLSDHELVHLRIGIHTGEVVFEDEDVFGDGVNVAARLEHRCAPGGVLISDNAQQSLDGKTADLFTGGDSLELKNVSRPVGVWRWVPSTTREESPSIVGAHEAPAPLLPDKPSIAVLPFDNLSNDEEQEFLADGLAEDITTLLSNLRWLFVVARNSAFTYKGQAVNITAVGRELGVRYVLEGSVRKAGDRVRVTAQLIDAQDGNHIWADRYDYGPTATTGSSMTSSRFRTISPAISSACWKPR